MSVAMIHPTAIVDPAAELGPDVAVGPFAIIGPGVTTGARCVIAPQAILERNVRLGQDVRVGAGAIVGGDPQDLKYRGEETRVEIGDRTVIREYATINRGTAATGVTRTGADCFVMSYVHLAHDCHVGNGVILANATQLAGHVTIHDRAIVSGLVAIHQFVTIGTLSFIGGCSRVSQDIPPFVKAVGNPVELYGLNTVGLRRAGVPPATVSALKRAYRLLFNSDLNLGQALEQVRGESTGVPEVDALLDFLATSSRGVPA
jgi:UDP-N-acetylglucosamine acyltransferase